MPLVNIVTFAKVKGEKFKVFEPKSFTHSFYEPDAQVSVCMRIDNEPNIKASQYLFLSRLYFKRSNVIFGLFSFFNWLFLLLQKSKLSENAVPSYGWLAKIWSR